MIFQIFSYAASSTKVSESPLDYRREKLYYFSCARVAELVDALDSKSSGSKGSCRFDSGLGHQQNLCKLPNKFCSQLNQILKIFNCIYLFNYYSVFSIIRISEILIKLVVNIMVTQLRERSQVTLPAEIVKKLDLKAGDNLEITLEDDRIVIKPVLIIDRSQSWFWSKEWQAKEQEVEEDRKAGRIHKASGYKDLIEKLEE
jgi:antitoxin MazE